MKEYMKPWLIGGIIACVALGFFLDLSTGIIILILLAYIIVLAIGLAIYETSSLKKAQSQIADALKYDIQEGIVILKKRHKDYSKCFFIENYEGSKLGYTEEKLVYTSVTVGGVTTGGVDKVGGYHTQKIKTDKYNLFFEYIDPADHVPKKFCVKTIILAAGLISQAEASDIRGYLKGDRIVVVTPLVSSDKELNAYAKLRELNGGGYVPHIGNISEDDHIKTMPSKEKCQRILNWICCK